MAVVLFFSLAPVWVLGVIGVINLYERAERLDGAT